MLAVFVAAVWAGGINAVVGSGTLVTFPVLLAVGVPPVSATMSNAIGLIPGNVSAAWGYRRELAGQRRRLLRFLPASLLGAVTGSWLLLHLSERAFESIVPVLLVLALLLVVFQKRLQARSLARREARGVTGDPRGLAGAGMFLAVYGTGVYGGYFTAAQGIVLIGIFGALLAENLQRLNALKNLLVLGVNLVAGATYVWVEHVGSGPSRLDWTAVALIASGSLVGGTLGARFGRRLPPSVLRGIIVVLSCVAIVVILTR